MRKSMLYFALALALAFSTAVQAAAKTSKASKDTKADQTSTMADSKSKTHTVTGCISGPNDEGAYLLKNGRYTKGLEIGGNDDLKNHVGHEVTLTGNWAKASDIGENEAAEKKAGKKEAHEKHFKVASIQMK